MDKNFKKKKTKMPMGNVPGDINMQISTTMQSLLTLGTVQY